MLGGRVLHDSVDDAGPVEPGRHGEPPGDGRGPEPADLLHPPDVQLQVRPLRGQRVQAMLGAPGQVAAQVGFGVLAGGALEAGQVGSHCQPQPVSERRQGIRRYGGQFGKGNHVLTLGRAPALREPGGLPHALDDGGRSGHQEWAVPGLARRSASVRMVLKEERTAASHAAATRSAHHWPAMPKSVPSSPE